MESGVKSKREKKLLEEGENRQQTQPTYDAGSENGTRSTLISGTRAMPHCS